MRTRRKSFALGNDSLGDFGARDPFPAEIETNFSDRVGLLDTEHRILIPNVAAMSLAQQECTPITHLQSPISEDDAQQLLRKVHFNFIYILILNYVLEGKKYHLFGMIWVWGVFFFFFLNYRNYTACAI